MMLWHQLYSAESTVSASAPYPILFHPSLSPLSFSPSPLSPSLILPPSLSLTISLVVIHIHGQQKALRGWCRDGEKQKLYLPELAPMDNFLRSDVERPGEALWMERRNEA